VSIRARVGGVRIPPYTELLTDEGVGIVHSIPIQFRSVSMRTYSAYASSKGHGRRSAFEHNYVHIRNGSPTRGWWISDGVRRPQAEGGLLEEESLVRGGPPCGAPRRAHAARGLPALRDWNVSSCLPPCLLLPPPLASSPSSCLPRAASCVFFVRVANLEAWATHAKLRPRMLSRNRVQGNIGPRLSSSQKGGIC